MNIGTGEPGNVSQKLPLDFLVRESFGAQQRAPSPCIRNIMPKILHIFVQRDSVYNNDTPRGPLGVCSDPLRVPGLRFDMPSSSLSDLCAIQCRLVVHEVSA